MSLIIRTVLRRGSATARAYKPHTGDVNRVVHSILKENRKCFGYENHVGTLMSFVIM